MKKTKTLIVIFIFYVISNLGCGKESTPLATCSEENTVKLPQDALDRFYFLDSTYWIYKDSISNNIDSVFVTKSRTNTNNRFESNVFHSRCYQNKTYETKSLIYGRTIVWLTPTNPVDVNRDYSEEFFEVLFKPEEINYQPLYRFYFLGNKYDNNIDDGSVTIQDSFKVGSIVFTQVLKYTSLVGGDIFKEAWYAKNLGLIKCRRLDGTIWELVRHEIKQ